MRVKRQRKPLSMTSLIDVIFLLLLFFMLSSTFSRYAEVPLPLGGGGTAKATTPMFLRVDETELTLNGRPVVLTTLAAQLSSETPKVVLISVTHAATSQRLADVLTSLRGINNIAINVLVPS